MTTTSMAKSLTKWGAAPVAAENAVAAIARQARTQPNAVAVTSPGESITFGELELTSNRLARLLASRGIGPESAVGLFMERTPAFVVGALAIWKAGGAYVPLDPAGPPQRLAAILRDSGAPILLSHRWKPASLASGPWSTIDISRRPPLICNRVTRNRVSR